MLHNKSCMHASEYGFNNLSVVQIELGREKKHEFDGHGTSVLNEGFRMMGNVSKV